MVDLMMWLVIAALLLASAIQGIGYYQKNAYVYQMKEAANVAASRIMAISATDGSVDASDADEIVADENNSTPNDQITLSVETVPMSASESPSGDYGMELASVSTATTVGPGETFYLRASHQAVGSNDVVYFFKDTTSQKAGAHLVKKGENGTTVTPTPSASPTAPATASPSPTATASPSPSATTSPSPTPTPTPTPTAEAAPPADFNAASAVIKSPNWWPEWYNNESAMSYTSTAIRYGFTVEGATSTNQANYKIEWSGGSTIGGKHATVGTSNTQGFTWWVDLTPVGPEGFKTGSGKSTVKVTNLTTNEVSYKTWTTTVTDASLTASKFWPEWYTNESAMSYTSGALRFGASILNANTADYTITFTGGDNINVGAYTQGTSTTQGLTWFADVTPKAEGFQTGTGIITMKATHNATGKVLTKDFTITVTDASLAASKFWPEYYTNESRSVGSTSNARFGASIQNATTADYTITFTGGNEVNADMSAVGTSTTQGLTWFSDAVPRAGGFTAGTSTITMTATHKSTGKVFTKTFTLTVQ